MPSNTEKRLFANFSIFFFFFHQAKERKIREKLARSHDENLDDQEVELLDENIQPTHEDMVSLSTSFFHSAFLYV